MSSEKKTATVRASPIAQPGSGDFYWEDGYLVFTRDYHLKRGFCCQSGCRHCPWGFRKTTERP